MHSLVQPLHADVDDFAARLQRPPGGAVTSLLKTFGIDLAVATGEGRQRV